MAEQYEQKKLTDQNRVNAECDELDAEIAALRAAYEQYFLGLERKPPSDKHKELKKRIAALRGLFVRQTQAKFRIGAIQQKFTTYERLWARTLQEIENGTYVRDLTRLKRKAANAKTSKPEAVKKKSDDFSIDEVSEDEADALLANAFDEKPAPAPKVAPAVAPIAPPQQSARPAASASRPPAPAAAANKSAPPPSGSPLADDKLRAVYDAFVKAKKRCNEDTASLSYEAVATSLRKQVPELMKQHNAKAVEFKVVIKDGKAILRAVPK